LNARAERAGVDALAGDDAPDGGAVVDEGAALARQAHAQRLPRLQPLALEQRRRAGRAAARRAGGEVARARRGEEGDGRRVGVAQQLDGHVAEALARRDKRQPHERRGRCGRRRQRCRGEAAASGGEPSRRAPGSSAAAASARAAC
jgi:hypothetical protein